MIALADLLGGLGGLCWRRPRSVILLWAAAMLVAAPLAGRLTERLLSGSGDVQASASQRVDAALRSDFKESGGQSLILTFRSNGLEKADRLLTQVKNRLEALPAVASAISAEDLPDPRARPKAGSGHLVLIQLTSGDVLAAEQEVPKIRAALVPLFEAAPGPPVTWAVSGRAALTHDINRFNAQDTARAEMRALPFTLAILIFAFGSLVAAVLPLVLALVTRTVALGLVFFVAGAFDVSNRVLSIVTMFAVALSIDYSLFLIHRYRRELARIGAGADGGAAASEERALRGAMAESGAAILYSAVAVGIGMGALLATPLMQTRSIGLGGLFAVTIALLAALTLVPALLRLLGSRLLEWPPRLSRRIDGERSRRLWSRWADVLLQRPIAAIVISLAVLLAMAAPALSTRFGFPESEFLPAELEYSRGMAMLDEMGLRGLVSPIELLVSDTRGGTALTPERVPLLSDFVSRIERDPRVKLVWGPVESNAQADAPSAPTISEAMEGALFRSAFVSADGQRLLFRIIPADTSDLAGLRELSRILPGGLEVEGLRAEVGGQAQYYNDFDEAVARSYPLVLGLVLGASTLVLLLFFRAPLATAKAILLNLLSVGAGYGIVVLVFQLGWGGGLFGLPEGSAVVPITVPLVIFCILFGLSMDYEIFLLSRVRKLFLESGDTGRSLREALADTGSVITSAALVMVAVFGAFAFARLLIVQMIGFGLAVAVLVDATVIRSALGPALMHIAGRWNWWPARAARAGPVAAPKG